MTKEELEKEAEEYAEGMAKYYASTHEDCIPSQFEKYLRNAYISSAEPREKRIAELTEQNTSLLTSVENLNKSVQELEKENAELKEELKDANKKVVHLACNQNIDLKRKINKAKEIIKTFCGFCSVFNSTNGSFDNLIAEAEQFLSEVEK